MFTTCIYCAQDLERNDVIEAFPVGRRIAFDSAHGRLWVVCRACQRWNLTPLEERWEAIEQAERLFQDTRLRVSTENIGMARLREGLELVRIGAPMRPEMAAWRYGDQFGRRRKRQLLLTGAAVGGAAAVIGGGLVAGIGIGSFAGWAFNGQLWDTIINGRGGAVVARVPNGENLLAVSRTQARMSALVRDAADGALVLRLEHATGSVRLHGVEAERAVAQLLPAINRFGGAKADVADAVSLLERAGGPARAISRIQQRSGVIERDPASRRRFDKLRLSAVPGALHQVTLQERLALEMALHEETERRAMDGELAELERAWRDADEIAQIADTMFDSPALTSRLSALRGKAGDGASDMK